MNAPTKSTQSSHPSPQEDLDAPGAVDPGDQDIDTAATNAYDEFASERGDSAQDSSDTPNAAAIAAGNAIDNEGRPIGPHDPSSMPRAEDDATVLEQSPEFNDRPGSGKYR